MVSQLKHTDLLNLPAQISVQNSSIFEITKK